MTLDLRTQASKTSSWGVFFQEIDPLEVKKRYPRYQKPLVKELPHLGPRRPWTLNFSPTRRLGSRSRNDRKPRVTRPRARGAGRAQALEDVRLLPCPRGSERKGRLLPFARRKARDRGPGEGIDSGTRDFFANEFPFRLKGKGYVRPIRKLKLLLFKSLGEFSKFRQSFFPCKLCGVPTWSLPCPSCGDRGKFASIPRWIPKPRSIPAPIPGCPALAPIRGEVEQSVRGIEVRNAIIPKPRRVESRKVPLGFEVRNAAARRSFEGESRSRDHGFEVRNAKGAGASKGSRRNTRRAFASSGSRPGGPARSKSVTPRAPELRRGVDPEVPPVRNP
jgi:hypothetical protein